MDTTKSAVTKHNIEQIISDYLKSQNVRFDISDKNNFGFMCQLYISSVESFIQVEYNLDDEEDDVIYVQLFTEIDSNGVSLYHSNWDNESNESIEGEIDELMSSVKRINQGLSKIQAKLDQIRDICDEYNLEFDEFIDVLFDFD